MKQARARLTHAVILDAAGEIFAARGFADTNLQLVADRIGLTKGALYGHFPSKAALAAAVIDEFDKSWIEVTTAARHSPGPALQTLTGLLLELSRRTAEDVRFLAGLRLSMAAARAGEVEGPHFAELRTLVTSLVLSSQEQGDIGAGHRPELLAWLLIAAVLGPRELGLVTGKVNAADVLALMWETVLPAARRSLG
ncbi:TetR/AcrR family transcriptional regulator [Streptomyces sp. ISL-14]|nr:TetR/AcrR family transcriptional regulator [Streptomyces sp. ISL-14]